MKLAEENLLQAGFFTAKAESRVSPMLRTGLCSASSGTSDRRLMILPPAFSPTEFVRLRQTPRGLSGSSGQARLFAVLSQNRLKARPSPLAVSAPCRSPPGSGPGFAGWSVPVEGQAGPAAGRSWLTVVACALCADGRRSGAQPIEIGAAMAKERASNKSLRIHASHVSPWNALNWVVNYSPILPARHGMASQSAETACRASPWNHGHFKSLV